MDNDALQAATIFDFTDNPDILETVLDYIPDKEEYIQYALPEAKAADLLSYAEYTNDTKLIRQIGEVFGKLLSSLLNE